MHLEKLTEHIYYSHSSPAGDRPALGYISGSKAAVMVDAGNSAAHNAAFLEKLAEKGLRTPEFCILTHWHWDHSFGLHALKMETYAHAKTNEKLREIAAWKWDDDAMRQRLAEGTEIAFADENIRMEYSDLQKILVMPAANEIQEEAVFDCGGITCRCLHLPSAHSDDSIVVYIPEEKILFIGDIYGDDFYNNHSRDLDKTKALHSRLSELDFTTAVPGHSAPLPKDELLRFLERFSSQESACQPYAAEK